LRDKGTEGQRHKAEKTFYPILLSLSLCLCAFATLCLHRGAKTERTFSPEGEDFPPISAAGKEVTMNHDFQEKEFIL
jgi:hypothetical protein